MLHCKNSLVLIGYGAFSFSENAGLMAFVLVSNIRRESFLNKKFVDINLQDLACVFNIKTLLLYSNSKVPFLL
jgi:hypothetical protein